MRNFKATLLALLLIVPFLLLSSVTAFSVEEEPDIPISMQEFNTDGWAGTIRNYRNSIKCCVNLREKPSLDAKVLTEVPLNASIRILSQDGKWFKVLYKDMEGYVFWKYVSFTEQPLDENLIGNSIIHYTSSENRDVNIGIACCYINGTVLKPGEEFSWFNVVGQTTSEKGYLTAPVLSGGKSVPGLGGGVCQVATTLYNALLDTGIKPTKHYRHSSCNYSDNDATVAYSAGKDFAFINTLDYDIEIKAYSYRAVVFVEICKH